MAGMRAATGSTSSAAGTGDPGQRYVIDVAAGDLRDLGDALGVEVGRQEDGIQTLRVHGGAEILGLSSGG